MAVRPHAIRCRSYALPYIQILSGRLARVLPCTSHPAGGVNTLRAYTPIKSRRLLGHLDLDLLKRSKRCGSAQQRIQFSSIFSPHRTWSGFPYQSIDLSSNSLIELSSYPRSFDTCHGHCHSIATDHEPKSSAAFLSMSPIALRLSKLKSMGVVEFMPT